MQRFFPIFFIVAVIMFSCSSNEAEDKSLCDCVEVGEAVNELSSSFFNRTYSVQGKDSLDALVNLRDSICAPFLEMHPNDLQLQREKCAALEISK